MLTDLAIRSAKASSKPFKMADALGLYLFVKPNGSKLWRFDYTVSKKRKTASLGQYPAVKLTEARAARDDLKRRLASGQVTPPSDATFGEIASEWLGRLELAEVTMGKKKWLVKDIAGPALGHRPIRVITSAEVLKVLRDLEVLGKRETARRLRSTISEVFRYAITTLRADNDPTYVLRGALLAPKVTHMAAITDPVEFGRLLTSIDEYTGWLSVKQALLFTALTFCRPGEVRAATWDEVDMDKQVWVIPAHKTKMRRQHEVPLSRQALEVLKAARSVEHHSSLIFPSLRSNRKPLSENAMNSALRRMGYRQDEMTSHGFRSSASTLLNERGLDAEVIELQLAHKDANTVRRIYNRGEKWPERVRLMQKWADMMDGFRLL